MKIIEIYCDGSAKNNGKDNSEGGYGICVLEKIQEPEKNQEKNYFAKIIDKGKRISLNIKQNYIESSSLVNLKVFASIFSGAN